ncbi:MAG: hypothetical protein KC502_07075 [Myxococcales bacterium]|nr:hypothetical protein [Myxococcales bacterium]
MSRTTDTLGANWPHSVLDFAGRRITISAGTFRVALTLPQHPIIDSALRGYGWHDPPGLPAPITLDVTLSDDPPVPHASVHDWSEAGFELRGKYVDGHFDLSRGTGTVRIKMGIKSPEDVLRGGILEAAMGALLHQVVHAGGVMVHAVSLLLEGRAHVVFGHSGAGKTTLGHRLPASFLNEEYAFMVPGPTPERWQWLWYAQERAPRVDRAATLPFGNLFAMAAARDETRCWPLETTKAPAALMPSLYWLPGMPNELLLHNVLSLVQAHPVRWFSHCLQTPETDVAALIGSDHDVR